MLSCPRFTIDRVGIVLPYVFAKQHEYYARNSHCQRMFVLS